jgi:hypothetical protein
METLLDHQVTLKELKQFDGFNHADLLKDYQNYVLCFDENQQSQDGFYLDIAELYDLRGDLAKANCVRRALYPRPEGRGLSRKILVKPSDHQLAPEAHRHAA